MKKCANQTCDGRAAVKKSISAPGLLFVDAELRQRALRLPTFSDYIQHLMRQDTARLEASGGSH